MLLFMHWSGWGDRGVQTPPPLENHKNIGFLRNTDQNTPHPLPPHLENHKALGFLRNDGLDPHPWKYHKTIGFLGILEHPPPTRRNWTPSVKYVDD